VCGRGAKFLYILLINAGSNSESEYDGVSNCTLLRDWRDMGSGICDRRTTVPSRP